MQVANAVGAALGTVAGRSERAESLREVIESLKSKYSDLTEDELRNKAIESLIQKGIEIATEAARKKGINGILILQCIVNCYCQFN